MPWRHRKPDRYGHTVIVVMYMRAGLFSSIYVNIAGFIFALKRFYFQAENWDY